MKQVTMALALAMMIAGCAGGGKPGAAATPKETLQNMVASLESGDTVQFVDCFKVEGDTRKMVEALGEFGHVALQFSKKVEAAYGADAVKEFNTGDTDFSSLVDSASKAEVKMEGDAKAILTIPDNDKPMTMVKDGAVWRIFEEDMAKAQDPKQLEMGLKMVGAMKDAMQDTMGKIGQDGESVATIKAAMEEKMKAVMMEVMAEAFKGMQPQK